MRHIQALAALVLGLSLYVQPAGAWDTRVIACAEGAECEPAWTSIYLGGASPSIAEHTTISDLALKQLGVRDIFGKRGSSAMVVTDLNASWLRRDHFADSPTYGDNPDGETALEERRIPPPAHFTGIPDFSYSVLDWINKNTFCPPFANADYPAKCHFFVGWLGGFNSPHFGSQATGMYARYHDLALNIASRAAALRARLGQGPEKQAHEDTVKEMELEALAFEGFAQHFLQDRWAMGHMWERWGAGDAAQMGVAPGTVDQVVLLGIGAVAGLLHGTEAVVNDPYGIVQKVDNWTGVRRFLDAADPMSSPVIRNGRVVPMEWRHAGEGENAPNNPGVGDERFNDLYLEFLTGTGQFGAGYGGITQRDGDLPFSAARQFNEMMTCSKAGWAEVIRAFGRHPEGGYGAHRAPLSADAPNFAIKQEASCWDMWATNASMYTGLMDDNTLPLKYLGVLAGSTVLSAAVSRAGLVAMAGKMWIRKYLKPNEMDLATGGMGELADVKPADGYKLPAFAMPARVTDLPEENDVGVDRRTLYGVFNRAHSDYWCENLEERLADLRGSEEEKDQQVCRYLADFAYQGTEPNYDGRQSRERLFEERPVRSICSVHGMDEREERDSWPFYLRPGYVPREKPEEDKRAYSTPEVGHWCDKVPVLDLEESAEFANDDVVLNIEPGQTDVYLRGVNLVGPKWVGQPTDDIHGSLTLYNQDGLAIADIISFHKWTDTAIHFDLPNSFGSDGRTGDFRVEVKRRDGVDSVGRFFLRISTEPPEIARVRALQGDDVYYDTEEDIFRPIPKGDVLVEITFKTDMKTKDASVAPTFLLGEDAIAGQWQSDRVWSGTVSHVVDTGSELRALSVLAQSLAGGWTDVDPDSDGNQPDTSYRLLLGSIPPILVSLSAEADGDLIYDATWEGGVDLREVPNVTAKNLSETLRAFDLSTADDLPSSGTLRLTLTFSEPLTNTPWVTVAGAGTTVSGAEKVWTAELDLSFLEGVENAQVEVTRSDGGALALDGSPRTQTVYDGVEGEWQLYEDRRGGRDTKTGGVDTWHVLGTPPDMSFVIVLDASGSMDDDDGRMEAAKAGIYNTLASLDDDVEVAVLEFSGCGSASAVGFTRDLESVKTFVEGVYPSGSTALADTISQARKFLIGYSHPGSREWRAAEFTDGQETCGGDVAGELYRLNAAIAEHGSSAVDRSAINADVLEDLEAEAAEAEDPTIVCQPDGWESYEVKVRESAEHLARISLIESRFSELELPDGRCKLELKRETYGIYYGSGRGSGWGINSRSSDVKIRAAVSSDGQGAVDAIRAAAQQVQYTGGEMYSAEAQISDAVRRSLANE